MPDIARRAFDVVAEARGARLLDELEAVAGAELRAFGFEVVLAVEITRRAGAPEVRPLFGDTTAPALQHYMERGHAAPCAIVRSASSTPVRGEAAAGGDVHDEH